MRAATRKTKGAGEVIRTPEGGDPLESLAGLVEFETLMRHAGQQ